MISFLFFTVFNLMKLLSKSIFLINTFAKVISLTPVPNKKDITQFR